jgi:hypothetical protein
MYFPELCTDARETADLLAVTSQLSFLLPSLGL